MSEVEVRVELLNVGWLTAAAGLWREGEEDPQRPTRVPVPAYLIETRGGRILVDTGLNPEAAVDAQAHYGPGPVSLFGLEQERSIAAQIDLTTITTVVLTHLHFDHAGGLELIPDSVPVVLQRAEWEGAHDQATIERNFFQRRDYEGRENITLVEGDHDLLGDGSVELISTPGHTPGHQSVRAGNLVIGADVTLYASGLDDLRLPGFGDDLEAQRRSAERLRALRDEGLTIQPGHDPEVLRPGPLAA
jgi:glyoxylase-like metal-dependent hydrolase (beta-lactamase superfamily II)